MIITKPEDLSKICSIIFYTLNYNFQKWTEKKIVPKKSKNFFQPFPKNINLI